MFSAIPTRLRSLKTRIEVVHLAVFISTLMKLPTLRVRSKTQQQKQITESTIPTTTQYYIKLFLSKENSSSNVLARKSRNPIFEPPRYSR